MPKSYSRFLIEILLELERVLVVGVAVEVEEVLLESRPSILERNIKS